MKKLYHPVCHMMHGERLYFIIVSFKSDPFNSANQLVDILNNNSLSDSSCAHLIFGDMDIILRIWATESHINEVTDYIDLQKNILFYKFILTENLTPWYSRLIEQNDEVFSLDKDNIDKILSGEIEDGLIHFYKENQKTTYSYKFWVFVEEPYSSSSGFYSQFNNRLKGKSTPNDLSEAFNISLYSYMTKTNRGFIFKANTENFVKCCDQITTLVETLSSDNEYIISTYIAREQLKEDGDRINFGNDLTIPIESKKKKIIYNLFKSHDCYRGMFEEDSPEILRFESVTDCLSPLIYKIFNYNTDWCEKIRISRNLTKWIVEEKNSMIISFLLREYVTLEAKMRKILATIYKENSKDIIGIVGMARQLQNISSFDDQYLNKVEQVLEKKIVPKRITFGHIPHLLNILIKFCPTKKLDQDECKLIDDFGKVVTNISEQRNLLAHGEVDFLFKNNKDNTQWLWVEFITSFMEYHFFHYDLFDILRKYTKLYNKETAQKATK